MGFYHQIDYGRPSLALDLLEEFRKELENFGKRVQYSVFECLLDARQLERLRTRLLRRIETSEDSLRIYSLCRTAAARWRSTGWER